MRPPTLKRVISLPLLVLYGVGTVIGAGIYALLGEIAGVAGYGAPLAFLIASTVAAFTACSFAELAGRYPRAAGAALYVQIGFDTAWLGRIIGLLVVLSGVVSSAAMINAFHGYLQEVVAVDRSVTVIAAALLLGAVAVWGIAESTLLAAAITLIEVGGLLAVVFVGRTALATFPSEWTLFIPGQGSGNWSGLLFGATLAFYAYIGFEDMVDVAEETRDVRRTLPLSILLTLAITTALYLSLVVTALLSLTPEELAASTAPLAALYEKHTGGSPHYIGIIAMFAIVNGALIQIVMASRVMYGLASRGQLPGCLGRVSARTRTPVVATATATALVVALALVGRLAGLATATSLIMLCIFTAVNLSLWRIKATGTTPPPSVHFPRWIPIAGAVLSAGLVIREILGRLLA
jgi:amino acid transporter